MFYEDQVMGFLKNMYDEDGADDAPTETEDAPEEDDDKEEDLGDDLE